MNKFRIVNTRFRILKGGKIGLAMSVAIIGGMLTLSSTSGHAADEFGSSVYRNYNTGAFTVWSSTVDSIGVYSADASDNNDISYHYTASVPNFTVSAGTNITGINLYGQLVGIYSKNQVTLSDGNDYDTAETNFHNTTISFSGNNDIRGIVGVNYDTVATFLNADTIGTINLNDVDVVFHQAVDAHTININAGSNTTNTDDFTFYGDVTTNGDNSFGANGSVEFNSAATVKFNGDVDGNIDFNGNNGVVTLAANKTIDGSIDTTGINGTLIFKGAGTVTGDVSSLGSNTLKEVRADGTGNVLFTNTNQAEVDYVNYQAAALIGFNGGLDLSVYDTENTVNTVTFNSHDGVLQINNGDLTGIEGQAVVTTSGNNLGTVTMVSGTQTITGNIGSSGHAIKKLNIGGQNTGGLDSSVDNYSTTTSNGDIFATNTVLDNNGTTNNSILNMASGYDITSTITTDTNTSGILNLAGGTQTVTGTVGTNTMRLAQVDSGANSATTTFTADVFSVDVNNTGTGTSNFNTNVTATDINVNDGTSNFTNNVTATTTNIATGTGNFSTNGTGTTTSAIAFSDEGTANLHTGLTGTINFAGNNATVNVWDAKEISGAIATTTDNKGIVNYKGDGAISSTVGATGLAIKELNINTNNEQNTIAGVTANGNIYAQSINLKNAGTLTIADDVNITTTLGTTTNANNAGTLNFAGTSTVEGIVGTSGTAIGMINAGATGKTVTFNDMVHATTLAYDANNSTVVLNGSNNGITDGLVGTVDFNEKTGTLKIGNNVNLTTGTNGIQFADANNASLVFDGNTTVNGVVGGDTAGKSTFKTISAGTNGSTVTFKNDVHVLESTVVPTTFHVSQTGTVNFEGNLYGDLKFDGDGIVNVSDAKSLIITTAPLAVYTGINNTGTLNFLGSTTVDTDIGEVAKMLKAVNFGTSGTSSSTFAQSLASNIYAVNTTIGNGSNHTRLNLTASDLTFGGNLTVDTNSTLNVAAYDAIVTGKLTAQTDATLKFTVDTNDIASGTSVANGVNSGSVDVSVLDIATDAKIHINYMGSLVENGTYTLVTADSSLRNYDGSESGVVGGNGLVTDNSWLINTAVSTVGTDLVLEADRTNGGDNVAKDLYVAESKTVGHFSNSAAQSLAGLSASGQQSGNLATLIQKYEIDGDGVADTAQALAQEVQKLAPVANTSVIKSTLAASSLVMNTVGARIADIRTTGSSVASSSGSLSGISSGENTLDTAVWIKAMGAVAKQDKIDQYDGYEATTTGMVIGIDETFSDSTIVGLALAYANTGVEQQDFRAGDTSTTNSLQAIAYASREFGKAYLDGALTYANHATDANRKGALGATASADIKATQLGAKIGTGYNYALSKNTTLTPFASIDYSSLEQDAYTETGSLAPLSVDDVSINRGTIGGGLKLATNITAGKITYVPEATLGAYGAFGDEKADVAAQFVGGGDKFVTPTQEMHETTYTAGTGVKTVFSQTSSLMLGVDYERSGDGTFEGYAGSLTYRLNF